MLKRPSKNDTEEDLLKFQEEFLASKSSPAVSVLKRTDKRKSDESKDNEIQETAKDVVSLEELPEIGSFNRPPEKKVKFLKKSSAPDIDDIDAEECLERHDHHITKVLSEIVERDFKSPVVYFPRAPTRGGFPTVLHRGSTLQEAQSQSSTKKKSLFAQQFLKSKATDFGVEKQSHGVEKQGLVSEHVEERWFGNKSMDISNTSENQSIITGIGLNVNSPQHEVACINEDNMKTLSNMTQDDILSEQANLLSMIDPNLVEFIKKRKQTKEAVISLSPNLKSKPTPDSSTSTIDTKMEITEKAEHHVISEEDLPLKPKREWVNMNKIEYDKMEWMKSVKPPEAGDASTGHTARFDFQGEIVAADANLPDHLGLHHHGKDPERAGYSLEEVFQLCRSSNMQQRVMSLHILAKIVENARCGKYADCASTYVIPALIDGGLIFITRWALDDSTDNTMAAAVNLLHKILVCEEDEQGFDDTFNWYQGHLCPQMCSQYPDQYEQVDEDGENIQETDSDVVKKDLIQGLIRMSILPRLRYILHKWHPAASVVVQVVQVLTRIARHSTQAAYQIMQCSGLIETLFKEFFPCHWNPVIAEDLGKPVTNVYGYPLPQVVKLIRVLCSSSRSIASDIVHKHNLMTPIGRYLWDDTESLQLQRKEAVTLSVEAYRAWQVCCSYGLTLSSYESLYPVLMAGLQKLNNITSIQIDTPDVTIIGTSLLSLLESVLQVAANVTIEASRIKNNQIESLSKGGNCIARALPAVNWSRVKELGEIITNFIQREIQVFIDTYFNEPYNLTFLSSVIGFVATYLGHVDSQPGYNAVNSLNLLENLCDNYLLPCIKSRAFQLTLRYLREKSVILCQMKSRRGEVAVNLPELGALCGDHAEKCPVLQNYSTVNFLVVFTKLLLNVCRIHKGLVPKLLPDVLQHEEALQYIRKVCLWQKKAPLAMNYFSKFENQLQFNLITMCRLAVTSNEKIRDIELYHQMALYLFMHLHQGNEHLVHSLLSTVMFNKDFLNDVSSEGLASGRQFEESLQLEEEKYLTSATTQVIRKDQSDLIHDCCSHLTVVRNCYLQTVAGLITRVRQARNRTLPNPLDVDKLQCGDVGQLLVPVDWPFLPLVELYNSSLNRNPSAKSEHMPEQMVEDIATSTLRWLYIMEWWRPGILDSVSLTLKLSRLLCVFLAGNDLFLNANIHGYLLALIKTYCKPVNLDRINLEEKVPGLASFYDLYMLTLNQYEAVSFGDPLFAGYVLLPQTQKHHLKYRKTLWGEQISVLQALTLPLDQVIIPIQRFLEPEELNLGLLRLYFQTLYSDTVTAYRNPLPYIIAVHHVNRFLYTQDGDHKKLKEAFIKQTNVCKNKDLRKHLFYYKLFNQDAKHGFELYSELPQSRRKVLEMTGVTEI